MLKHLFAIAALTFGAGCASCLLSGCATFDSTPKYALVIKNVDWPLQELSSLVAFELPTGLRTTSENGREFYSKYFVLDGPKYKPASDAVERYTATVIVLGDSRPYDLEIFVTKEKRVLEQTGFDYAEIGHNTMLARELEYKLRQELSKRREDRNIIDDFRVF
jgi:hypothetical protein